MSNAVDVIVLYSLIKSISTPFNETEAHELGLIDERGKLLKRPKTREEKKAYSAFNRVVFNIKRILQRFGLDKKYATYAGALLLMKEENTNYSSGANVIQEQLLNEYNEMVRTDGKTFAMLRDEIANVTGTAVVGTGDDPVHWKQKKKKEVDLIKRIIDRRKR